MIPCLFLPKSFHVASGFVVSHLLFGSCLAGHHGGSAVTAEVASSGMIRKEVGRHVDAAESPGRQEGRNTKAKLALDWMGDAVTESGGSDASASTAVQRTDAASTLETTADDGDQPRTPSQQALSTFNTEGMAQARHAADLIREQSQMQNDQDADSQSQIQSQQDTDTQSEIQDQQYADAQSEIQDQQDANAQSEIQNHQDVETQNDIQNDQEAVTQTQVRNDQDAKSQLDDGSSCTCLPDKGVYINLLEGCPSTSLLEVNASNSLAHTHTGPATHCRWGDWSCWSGCSTTCGIGSRYKSRQIAQQPGFGGRPCDDPDLIRMEKTCSPIPCPIDCLWTAWAAWTACTTSCQGGRQERTRIRNHTSEHGGAECQGAYRQEQNCNQYSCPIDCITSEWAEWGNCNEECGGGARHRRKTVRLQNQHGGADCPPLKENETCNEDVCPIKAGTTSCSMIPALVAFLLVVLRLRTSQTG